MALKNGRSSSETAVIISGSVLPAGTVAPFASGNTPTGWFMCDGTAVSRTTYAALFDSIGTTYGVGDGSTTFNLPDYRGMFLRGKNNSRSDGNEDPDGERALGDVQVGKTKKPISDFTGSISASSDPAGGHTHTARGWSSVSGGSSHTAVGYISGGSQPTTGISAIDSAPNHSHNITGSSTVTGGGDNETRPKNITVNYIIKY